MRSGGITPHFLKLLTVKVSDHVHGAFPIPTLTYGVRCRMSAIIDLRRFREEIYFLSRNYSSKPSVGRLSQISVTILTELSWLHLKPHDQAPCREELQENRGIELQFHGFWISTTDTCELSPPWSVPYISLVKSLRHSIGGWVVPMMWWW